MSSVSTHRVCIYDGSDALPSSYAPLHGAAEQRYGFYFSDVWFRHLESAVLGHDGALRIYGVERQDSDAPEGATPVLALPMYAAGASKRFSLRMLRAASNYYTSFFGAIAADATAEAEANWLPIAKAIADESPGWDVIDLHPLDRDGDPFRFACHALADAGMLVQTYFCFGNWTLAVNGRSWSAYSETLPAKLKNTLQRKSLQLHKKHAARLLVLTGEAEAEQGIDAFMRVYQASWKEPEPYPDFMPGLIRLCAKKGWLRLGVAYVDDVPAAAQLWIVCAGVASIYKLAYDEHYARLSVGTVLTAKLMEHVLDVDRVREVDYLTGDEPYKQDWMSHRRERWGIVAFNKRSLRGLLAAARHVGGRALKRLAGRV